MKRLAALAVILIALTGETAPVLPPDLEIEHVVQSGETLGGIAQRAKVPRVLIIEANRLKPPYHVRIGQRLTIPRTRHHTVSRGDSQFTIAYLYGVPWKDIAVANGLEPGAALKPGARLLIPTMIPAAPDSDTPAAAPAPAQFTWPLSGSVRRGFTARATSSDYHDGIDIRVRGGTAVRAAAAGKVLFAGDEPRQFGKLVVIGHEGGWQSAYAFLSRVTVKEGEEVRQGERVGLSGRTGLAKGDELHFEVRRNNRPVDPETLLGPAK